MNVDHGTRHSRRIYQTPRLLSLLAI
jgi:hypothetical protein